MINSKFIIATLLLIQLNAVKAGNLPIDTLGSKDMSKPLVLYISGDGGFNNFSNTFIKQWNNNGYPVVALNAKVYFWQTKNPEDMARDASGLITKYLSLWHRKEVILLGFSFGADVMPFIQTKLAPDILSKVKETVLFSPSKNTDFTIHLFYDDKGCSVAAEINKLTKPVLIVFGNKENDLPEPQISNKMANIIKVEGGHHYNNAITGVIDKVISKL